MIGRAKPPYSSVDCHKCGALAGHQCRAFRRGSSAWKFTSTPHAARIRLYLLASRCPLTKMGEYNELRCSLSAGHDGPHNYVVHAEGASK